MSVTGRYLLFLRATSPFQYPEEKTPQSLCTSAVCMRSAVIPNSKEAASAVNCAKQLSGNGDQDRSGGARRRYATHHALRHRPDQMHFLRVLRRSLPGGCDCRNPHLEFHGEKRGDLYYTKPMLLAIGEKHEAEIAKDRAADASTLRRGSTMNFETIFFYFFAAVIVFAAFRVITARNPVHAALFLVLAFFSCAGHLAVAGSRIPRHRAGAGVCRRGDGAVPVRGDDAGHQYGAVAPGFWRWLPFGAALAG